MIRLLSIEFFKLRHNRASKVLTIFYFGLLTSIALVSAIKVEAGPVSFKLADQGIFEFPFIWHFNTYVAALFKFFLLFVIVSMVANEYANKTLKQNLIDGLSKKEYILSKFYMVVAMSLASTIFVFIVSLILGLIYSNNTELAVIFTDWEYFIGFFVKLVSFFSLGLFMGIWIKRSAFAIGGVFIFYILEGLSTWILSFFISNNLSKTIQSVLPFGSSELLIPQPFKRMEAIQNISNQLGGMAAEDYSVPFFNVLISLLWSAVFIYGAYLLIYKRDL
ncbi:MAG: ABC transporter permease [Flavobacteriales bacterium]|jgi:hypothetical protein|nr:ABC transporter permease [Flavobacteriales bacterium]